MQPGFTGIWSLRRPAGSCMSVAHIEPLIVSPQY
jgi:hypothetical protein